MQSFGIKIEVLPQFAPASTTQRKHVLPKLGSQRRLSIFISFGHVLNLTLDSNSVAQNTSSIKVWDSNEQFSKFVRKSHYFCPRLYRANRNTLTTKLKDYRSLLDPHIAYLTATHNTKHTSA
jgi:hypothetical protein